MRKKELWILAAFAAVIIVFFWDLAILKHAFLSGDHREQQFPWAKFYQEQIRSFQLPWWTPDIHCGFPLLAEGQIGAFYPLNYLFFLILPVKAAYNYIILFQYWLGAALFYWFLRRLKISIFPAFLACLIYLFGSTQGGYFYYNYISQKVVIWLPLALILIDRLIENRKWQEAFWLGAVFAVMIFGGYLQVAIYTIFYCILYFLWRWWEKKDLSAMVWFAGSGVLGIFFSLCQLLPTFELSVLSSRASAEKGLAYVGSMNPMGFATLFYPSWDGILGSELYIGLAGLLFVFMALTALKGSRAGFFLAAAVFFLLLALGKYSPLYRLIVETTGFNSFRTPIKFLFFVSFSLIVLAAVGADRFFNGKLGPGKIRGSAAAFAFVCLGFILLPSLAGNYLVTNRQTVYPKFENMVVKTYHGKAGHPFSVEHYKMKAAETYDSLIKMSNTAVGRTHEEFVLLLVMFAAAFSLIFMPRPEKLLMVFFLAFLLFDLYRYGFTSIKAGEEPFNTIDGPVKSKIVQYLKQDTSLYRVMEVYSKLEQNRSFPVFPSTNMLDHIQDMGAYSPLVMKKYKNYVEGWIYINNSLSTYLVDPVKLKEHLPDLSLLNVKYLMSLEPLNDPSLEPIMEENGVLLYRNKNVKPRAFFLPGDASIYEGDAFSVPVTIKNYKAQSLEVEFNAPGPGRLYISDLHYYGWEMNWNGKNGKLVPKGGIDNLFRAVKIEKPGPNTIKMSYSTGMFKTAGLTALAFFIWGTIEIFRRDKPEKAAA